MSRKELREHIFKILFQIEFCSIEEMPENIDKYFETIDEIDASDKEYISNKCKAVIENLEEIDTLINENTEGWKTSRMSKIDLTVLRLAVYEMKWDEDIPEGVAINEAVELTKKYSGKEGPAFVNGVLGKMAVEKKAAGE